MKASNKPMVRVNVPQELKEEFRRHCQKQYASESEVIRGLMRDFCQRQRILNNEMP